MGGEGSGRKWIYNDERHRKIREHQRKYDREIAEIRKKHKCGYTKAQDIRIERLRKEARERLRKKK